MYLFNLHFVLIGCFTDWEFILFILSFLECREESDIVIISLVRSNCQGNIGFLKEAQRVNVLLSRARYGLYIIGNSQTLRRSPKGRNVWSPILNSLEEKNQLLPGFPTTCQLHPDDDPILISDPESFRRFRPNGGCTRPCKERLECGHVCPQVRSKTNLIVSQPIFLILRLIYLFLIR